MHPAMKILPAVMMAVLTILPSVNSHSYDLGNCPNLPAMDKFDPDQFSGLWYMIEVFGATSKCMKMMFNRTATGYDVIKARELYIGKVFNIDHTIDYEGQITITNAAKPSEMEIRWPANVVGSSKLKVLDTDYQNFALLFECQFLYVINRHSLIILSRQPTLDTSIIERLKQSLPAGEVDVDDFDIIDHRDCNQQGEGDFNFKVNEDTFKFLGTGGDGSQGPSNPEIPNADAEFNELF